MTGKPPFTPAFPFDREGASSLQTKWALERIKCTGPETHGEDSAGVGGSTLTTLLFLLRQQEQWDQCFKTLLTTEPALKETSMCICTCAQVCTHAQMLVTEHRHKGPVKEQPQGRSSTLSETGSAVICLCVCQASWDPSFHGSTGTTSVYDSPLYLLSHDPSS